MSVTQVSPHPELMMFQGNLDMVLVKDQPVLDRVYHGAPDLGWAGDVMLGVYSWPRQNCYVVLRLMGGDEYQWICRIDDPRPLSPAGVNQLIRRLIAIDTHRGFDPHAAVIRHNEAVDATWKAEHDDWVDNEIAPKAAWAYRKGGNVHEHFGGLTAPWNRDVPEADEPEAG